MATTVEEVFPLGGSVIENYLSRPQYEHAALSALELNRAAALVGRSGYGKSSIVSHLIRTRCWKYAKVICYNQEKFSELMDELHIELIRKTITPRALAELWIFISGISEIPYIGGSLKKESLKHTQKIVMDRASKNDTILVFEKVEKLNTGEQQSIVNLINALADIEDQGARPKLLCLSITPLRSARETGQRDRFRNIEIGRFDNQESANQVRLGLKKLGVEIAESAIQVAGQACCGSPLASSQLMAAVLKAGGITEELPPGKRYKVSRTEVANMVQVLADADDLSTPWREVLKDRSSELYKVLRSLVYVGHQGSIDEVANHLGLQGEIRTDVASRIDELSVRCISGGYPDLALNDHRDAYAFNEPFLYEKLVQVMGPSLSRVRG